MVGYIYILHLPGLSRWKVCWKKIYSNDSKHNNKKTNKKYKRRFNWHLDLSFFFLSVCKYQREKGYVCVIDHGWGQDGWILAEFFVCLFGFFFCVLSTEMKSRSMKVRKTNESNILPSWLHFCMINRGFIVLKEISLRYESRKTSFFREPGRKTNRVCSRINPPD